MLTEPALSARPWPADREQALSDLQGTGCTVLALSYSAPPRREFARTHAREVLMLCLCALYQCGVADIALSALAGHPPVIQVRGQQVFASFSHEPHISLVAIDVHGPVGIDVLSLNDPVPSPQECVVLAKDYLPPDTAARIASLPGQDRPLAFAQAWAQHEAMLKCHGRSLEEWRDAMLALYHNTPCKRVATGPGYIAFCASQAQA